MEQIIQPNQDEKEVCLIQGITQNEIKTTRCLSS